MNCKDFENMIHELVSRRVADKTMHLQALEHAGHCLWCALRLDEETKLAVTLQAFASTLQSQRAPVRVEEALVRAFRERTSRTSTRHLGLAGRRLWRGLTWGLALAASVAIAWIIIIQGLRLHSRSNPSPQRVGHSQPPAASEDVAPQQAGARAVSSAATARTGQILKSGVTTEQHSQGQVAPPRRLERVTWDESASELTTDFISLGTCDDSQCMDEATLVRVTLPAEAPLAFGLGSENDFAMEGSVQADVALGSDGLPFAIRFVD